MNVQAFDYNKGLTKEKNQSKENHWFWISKRKMKIFCIFAAIQMDMNLCMVMERDWNLSNEYSNFNPNRNMWMCVYGMQFIKCWFRFDILCYMRPKIFNVWRQGTWHHIEYTYSVYAQCTMLKHILLCLFQLPLFLVFVFFSFLDEANTYRGKSIEHRKGLLNNFKIVPFLSMYCSIFTSYFLLI